MKIIKQLFWIVPAILVLIYSCKKEVYDTTPDTNDLACDTVTYIEHVEPIFKQNCISCHVAGGTGPGDYTILANIQRDKDKIKEQAVTNSFMPQGGTLSSQQKYLLGKWIDCGTNGTEPAKNPACDTLLYEKQVKTLFDKNCNTCHKPGVTGPGDFTKLENIRSQKERIKIRAVTDQTMPQGFTMTKEEIEMLGNWIDCGTKGNEVYNGPVWENDVDSIFINNCVVCHNPRGSAPGDYSNYDTVKFAIENKGLENRVFVLQDMPKDTTLKKEERIKLKEWLDSSYPKNK